MKPKSEFLYIVLQTYLDPDSALRHHTFLIESEPEDIVDAAFQDASAQTKVQWTSLGNADLAHYRASRGHMPDRLFCSEAQAAAYLQGTKGDLLMSDTFALTACNMLGIQDRAKLHAGRAHA